MEESPQRGTASNPFPGLRPFEADEEHLFFGREEETDELLRRLRAGRFLLVAGSSGTGKSSLVRSGLIPALESGFMLEAGSKWRIVTFRPGDNPVGNLACAMDAPDVLGTTGELATTNRILLEATLERGSMGIVQAVRQAQIPPEDNVLIVVDQFEELFRFRRSGHNSRDEALAFFRLLLEATRQEDIRIYVVLTMRSDFLGDCIEFQGLPEAASNGLYLIPRMTRDELRSAITGPVAVAGASIAPRLVQRLLNDVGDNPDQLPLLQHALMRTWDRWTAEGFQETVIDIADYEAIGGLQQALSLHAEEAFSETAQVEGGQRIAQRMFKALTDTWSDPRGVRRATPIAELAAVCESPEKDVMHVVEIFRRRGRSFLTPQTGVPLESPTVIDLSHESLMRCWTRLVEWTREERDSARTYMRVAQAAAWWSEASGSLWTDPQLEIALQWRNRNNPTSAWAARYDSDFTTAMQFLDRSAEHHEAERKTEKRRRRSWQVVSGILAVSLMAIGLLAWIVERQSQRAEKSLNTAMNAIDDSLASLGTQDAREAPDSPEMEEFRRELAAKARGYYVQLARYEEGNETLDAKMAKAWASLGDIDRLMQNWQSAVDEYEKAIAQFERLAGNYPVKPYYKEELASSHMWMGETLRQWLEISPQSTQHTATDVRRQYDESIRIQQQLTADFPATPVYEQELARSYYNRGILLRDDRLGDPLPDLQHAFTLLTSVLSLVQAGTKTSGTGPPPAQELARVENNLGVFYTDQEECTKATLMFEKAIASLVPLRRQDPASREYKFEEASYYANFADALACDRHIAAAKKANRIASNITAELSKPAGAVADLQAKIDRCDQWLATQ